MTDSGNVSSVAVLAGGFDFRGLLSTVETFSASGTCQHELPPLPRAVFSPILGFTSGILFVCGGTAANGHIGKTCLRFEREEGAGKWVEDTNMVLNEDRWKAASAMVDGKFWIT